jgi:hypothetical protein
MDSVLENGFETGATPARADGLTGPVALIRHGAVSVCKAVGAGSPRARSN